MKPMSRSANLRPRRLDAAYLATSVARRTGHIVGIAQKTVGLSSTCLYMELTVVPIVKPDAANFVFGQSHFIKTVEDLHEALVGAVPGIRFGLAFCEASGKRLVRWSGNDEAAVTLARDNALVIGAGHTFLIFLGDGFFPVNVLAAVRTVPEVCRIYCATANPTQVIVAQTELGRGVLGVVDGASPLGVETDADIAWRKDLLRKIGYKLQWLDEPKAD